MEKETKKAAATTVTLLAATSAPPQPAPASVSLWSRLASASVGGTLVALFLCPFDVVTRRLQAEEMHAARGTLPALTTRSTATRGSSNSGSGSSSSSNSSSSSSSRNGVGSSSGSVQSSRVGDAAASRNAVASSARAAPRAARRAPLQILVSIVKNESPFALWRGLWPTLIM